MINIRALLVYTPLSSAEIQPFVCHSSYQLVVTQTAIAIGIKVAIVSDFCFRSPASYRVPEVLRYCSLVLKWATMKVWCNPRESGSESLEFKRGKHCRWHLWVVTNWKSQLSGSVGGARPFPLRLPLLAWNQLTIWACQMMNVRGRRYSGRKQLRWVDGTRTD